MALIIFSLLPAGIYLLKINDANIVKVCSDLTIKNKNDIIDFVLLFLLLTLFIFTSLSSRSIFDFEQVNIFGN